MPAELNLRFFPRSAVPVVLQGEAAECGLACLAMVAGYHGRATGLSDLRGRLSLSLRGMNLAQLIGLSQEQGLAPRAVRLELEHLRELRCPAILHWNFEHFVVLEGVTRDGIRVVDPAVGRRRMAWSEVSRQFTGVALELTPTASFARRRPRIELPLSAFFRGVHGLWAALARVLALSVALQLLLLLAPLFAQLVIDDVVPSADRDLLTVLGLSFAFLVVLQVAIQWLRSWLVVVLGADLEFAWGARLFHHLLCLPLTYFEKRHMGDVVSRFGSLAALQQTVSQTVVEGIVDGLLAGTVVVVMLYYAPLLTVLVLFAVALYACVRLLLFAAQRHAAQETLVFGARENTAFMESIRAILPLKNFARESLREAFWQNRKAEAVNAALRLRRLQVLQEAANTAIFGFAGVAVIWLGAQSILEQRMSVGMLAAFMAYQQQFGMRAAALIDRLLELRLVGVHRERLADMALAERDPAADSAAISTRPIDGLLEASGLSFRYADGDPAIVSDLDLCVEPGECVVIAAPSGRGKTTLIKLLMGLLPPASGEIRIDGVDIHRGALAHYRRQSAAVMQDDALLSGTLADNISFFAPQSDAQWLEECARLAAIHDDILRMPMGYFTRVGDMGSALSGGQRQRILLARALYARPRVLFLDEATSHLDAATERRIHEALARMRITRVLVAHRQETLKIADRVIALP